MFTGIIEEVGVVREILAAGENQKKLVIGARKVLEGSKIGDSMAVNGVCLTIEDIGGTSFQATVVEETLAASTLGSTQKGADVNLERAARIGDRIGGHLVQGHVDTTGVIEKIWQENDVLLEIAVDKKFHRYLVPKGSVACDGISLTLTRLTESGFIVSVIPHTLKQTNLVKKNVNDQVNLEFDMSVKTIIHHMDSQKKHRKFFWIL